MKEKYEEKILQSEQGPVSPLRKAKQFPSFQAERRIASPGLTRAGEKR